jgi:uncharacterized membrane protein
MSNKKNSRIFYGWLIISIIGFIDAVFLSVEKLRGAVPPCSLTNGCEAVTTSAYSYIAGIPVALFGTLYYLTVIFLSFALIDTKKALLAKAISYLTITGFVVSVYLVFLQLFVIKAVCQYCMLSALTSSILFVLSIFYWKNSSSRNSSILSQKNHDNQ